MKYSIYTYTGILLKSLLRIEDFSLFKKNLHKKIGKIFYRTRYNADDIVRCMCSLGMRKGSVVCIHSSMKEFYNYNGTAEELIERILEAITPEGTLIMPAFPPYKWQDDSNYIFNPEKDRTDAGYLAETFRKYPGVSRSINVRHSICAIGKYAKELTEGHQYCTNCWDENSPWYKMTRLNALVFNIGMPRHYIGTFDHCVEGILYKEHPYWAQFFNLKRRFRCYDNDGNIIEYESMDGKIEQRSRENNIIKLFNAKEHRNKKISNLYISVFDTKPCLDKMIDLGRKGKTIYYIPSPKKFKFQ